MAFFVTSSIWALCKKRLYTLGESGRSELVNESAKNRTENNALASLNLQDKPFWEGDKYYAWGKKMLNAAEQAKEIYYIGNSVKA